MQTIVIASNNQGKINEFNHIFKDLDISIISQAEFNVPEIDEPYPTFLENALHKARHCAKYTNLPSLADDSGICVPSLGGKPGVYSARYAGVERNDILNNQKLITALKDKAHKLAYFYCTLVLVNNKDDPQPKFADGKLYGEIIAAPKGTNGFGYDPIFWLPEYQKTVAELDISLKIKISHRAKAIEELYRKLHDEYKRKNI